MVMRTVPIIWYTSPRWTPCRPRSTCPYVQRGLVEVLLLSVGAGLLGSWIVLRGLAFYSHAVGSAAFPGLVLADGLGFAAPLGALGAAARVRAPDRRARAAGSASARTPRRRVGLAGMLALGVILASDVFESGVGSRDAAVRQPAADRAARPRARGRRERRRARGDPDCSAARGSRRGFDPPPPVRSGVRAAAVDAVLLALIALVVVAALSALGALLVARCSWCRPRPCACGPTAWRRGRRSPSRWSRPRASPGWAVGGAERAARRDDRGARRARSSRSRPRRARAAGRGRARIAAAVALGAGARPRARRAAASDDDSERPRRRDHDAGRRLGARSRGRRARRASAPAAEHRPARLRAAARRRRGARAAPT